MDEKVCISCKMVKPPTAFYAHPYSADRLMGVCKECHKARMKVRDPEKVSTYERKRAQTPERRAYSTQRCRADRKRYPERYAARTLLNNALRAGRIVRATHCEECGVEGGNTRATALHGHHHDYYKPLEVKWLCAKCHHNGDRYGKDQDYKT